MRNILVITTLLATASLAHADPLSARASTEAAPSTYLATGVTLGGVGSHTGAGVSADVSEHVWKALWVHVGGTMVDDSQFLVATGSYRAAYAGVELSSCQVGDRICAYVGGDVGYADSQYSGSSSTNDWGIQSGSSMTENSSGAIGVLRGGFDIGGRHLRWRPGVQATIAGPSAAAITQSVAFRF